MNPADINTKTVLSVGVEDEFKILTAQPYYSGEIYAGEV